MKPNQYRCETCSFKGKSRHTQGGLVIDCDKHDLVLNSFNDRELINRVGCASHSSYQSERDKVLDYLDEWINSGENLTLYKWEVREVIRELRQKAGEQE